MLFTPEGSSSVSQIQVRAQDVNGTYMPQGALIVAGTQARPVVFESAAATPAPGDWQGLYFADVVDSRTSISFARIMHAGGWSGTTGVCPSTPNGNTTAATCAIIASLQAAPVSSFVSNTHIEGAICGIYRGWRMGDVDFVSGNDFASISGCLQSSVISGSTCAPCQTQ